MAGAQPRTSCRSLFKQFDIIPFHCQYIPSLMTYIIQNQENFKTNSSVQNLNIRNMYHFTEKMPTFLFFKISTFYAKPPGTFWATLGL